MKIKYLAHSSFLFTSNSGVRVISDPYTPDDRLHYRNIDEAADIVTVSHDHFDHNNTKTVKGNPVVLKGSAEIKGINFKAINSFHDASGGKKRGPNIIFCFKIDGIRICHMGDLGHIPDEKMISEMGKVDVLFIPAGGYFTFEPDVARQIIDRIKPKVAIPMHYKTEKSDLLIAGVEKFLAGMKNIKKLDTSEIEYKPDNLPEETEIVVMKPAL